MAPALEPLVEAPVAAMHPDTLAGLGASAGATITIALDGGRLTVPVAVDAAMAPGVLAVARHHALAWQVGGETRLVVEHARLKVEG